MASKMILTRWRLRVDLFIFRILIGAFSKCSGVSSAASGASGRHYALNMYFQGDPEVRQEILGGLMRPLDEDSEEAQILPRGPRGITGDTVSCIVEGHMRPPDEGSKSHRSEVYGNPK